MLVRVQTVQQFLLFLDLAANNRQVEHLDEMRDIHTRVLHDMAVLLVGIDRGLVIVFRLHHYVLKRHEETLHLRQCLVRNHLLRIVRRLRLLNGILQGMQAG